jgi:hypothetical protein
MYAFIASFNTNSHHLTKHRIPWQLANDIAWWHVHLSSPACTLSIKELPPALSSEIHVDASTSWGIGFVMDTHWLAWHLIPGWHSVERDIGWSEMVAVELALHTICSCSWSHRCSPDHTF